MIEHLPVLNTLLSQGTPLVVATVIDTAGSVPTEKGAKMIVTSRGREYGTVGGGKIERRAIEEAQRMIEEKGDRTLFVQWNLNKDIGMTCGGIVKLFFELENVSAWTVVVFGAGHVGNALISLLVTLDCDVICIDPRSEWLERLPSSPRLRLLTSNDMPAEVAGLPADAYVVLMTMGHTTDKPILLEILKTRQFPFLGVIGSRAKANRLQRDVREAGLPESAAHAFFCPIGIDIGSNAPAEIAISVAAQFLQHRDVLIPSSRGEARSEAEDSA